MKHIYTLVLFVLFASCFQTDLTLIEIKEIENLNPQMVLFSIVDNTTKTINVYLSRTEEFYGIDTFDNETFFPEVENIESQLILNGEEIGHLQLIPQAERLKRNRSINYKATLPKLLEVGDELTISILHPDYGEIKASDIMPSVPFVENLEFIPKAGFSQNGEALSGIHISFKDPGNEANYYMIQLQKERDEPIIYSNLPGDTLTFDYIRINTNDPNYKYNIDEPRRYPQAFLFDDQLINGQDYDMTILFAEQLEKEKLTLVWYNISQSWYEGRFPNRSGISKYDNFLSAFTVTENLPSNVEGGYGLFVLGTKTFIKVE